jgi:hypothetical protein
MPTVRALQEWVAGMVSSNIRGGNMKKSTFSEIDGAIAHLRQRGLTPDEIKFGIQLGRDRSPRRDSDEAAIITQRYLI